MILVDTSIFIDYFRGNPTYLDAIIDKNEICTCGIVAAELYHGTRTSEEKDRISRLLNELTWVDITREHWITTGENLNRLRSLGITVPFQDVVLATLCSVKTITLYSADKHFRRLTEHISGLVLYPE